MSPESKDLGFKSLVLVSGLVGLGKSALLDFVAQDERVSARKVQLYRSKSHALQNTSPYLIWKQIFRLILGTKDGNTTYETLLARLRTLFAESQNLNLLDYLPVLGLLERSLEGMPDSELAKLTNQDRGVILTELCQHILELSSISSPVILLLDDIQHMDESSFRFLCTFMESPVVKKSRLLIVAGVRSVSKDTLDEKYAKIDRNESVILKPLSDEIIIELAFKILRSRCKAVSERRAHSLEMTPQLKQFLMKNSIGNPMFLGIILFMYSFILRTPCKFGYRNFYVSRKT